MEAIDRPVSLDTGKINTKIQLDSWAIWQKDLLGKGLIKIKKITISLIDTDLKERDKKSRRFAYPFQDSRRWKTTLNHRSSLISLSFHGLDQTCLRFENEIYP